VVYGKKAKKKEGKNYPWVEEFACCAFLTKLLVKTWCAVEGQLGSFGISMTEIAIVLTMVYEEVFV